MMEINSAIIIGFFFGTYMFLFCIATYYINNILFRNNVSVIGMFFYFKKPLYSYRLKSGIKINFGYLPVGTFVSFNKEGDIFGEAENETDIKYDAKRNKILNLIILAVTILILFPTNYILGYDPFKIFKDIFSIEYHLITKSLNFKSLTPVITERYQIYGKYFFIIFFVLVQMMISSALMFIFSLWEYLGTIAVVLIIFAYFRYDLTYFMLPLSFYIDMFLSFVASGFIYFLLLRFFIK